MRKRTLAKLLLPLVVMSGFSPITTLTSCEFSQVEFKFNNDTIYLPINMIEDLTSFMTIDKSILPREILWSCSDPDTVKISSTGLARGVRTTGKDQVKITATLYGNSVTCNAIVGEFSFNTNMIVLRESANNANVYETYLKSNSANINRYINLSTGDENIAKVDNNGNIIPVSEGITELKAISKGGTTISTNICIERDILDQFRLTDTTDEQSYIISEYTGNDAEVVLPRYKNGKTIRYLGKCFDGNSKVTKVTVPDTYTKIIDTTFIDDCSELVTLVLPDTLEDIKDYIFKNCPKYQAILDDPEKGFIRGGFQYIKSSYPEGREESPKNSYLIAMNFDSLNGDTRPSISKDCKVICHRAFNRAVMGETAFAQLGNLGSIVFPNDSQLVCISDEAYSGNTYFRTLFIPDTVKYIHNSLKNMGNLTSFHVPDSLEYIGTNWLDGTVVDPSILDCFTSVGELVYLGSTKNKFLILYGLKEQAGSVLEGGTPNFEVIIEPQCKIIGPNAFSIWSNQTSWLQGRSNALTRINKPSNDLDKTNRLFTGTVSSEDSSIVCICGNAFKDCDNIDNLILSAFVKYFDIAGIGSSRINNIYCEAVNPPPGFDFSAEEATAKARVLYQSLSYRPGNYWHYNEYRVPAKWESEEE